MKKIIALVLVVVSFISCKKDGDNKTTATFDRKDFQEKVTQQLILPAHENFTNKAATFSKVVSDFITNPDQANLIKAQEEWKELSLAYRKCEMFDMGEAKKTYLHSSFNFWPINQNQIENYIVDNTTMDKKFFEFLGSNTKGLFAFEYLLYNRDKGNSEVVKAFTGNTKAIQRRKDYLKGVADILVNESKRINDFWTPSGQNYGSRFSSDTENGINGSFNILVNALSNLTERIAVKKLGKPLGKGAGDKISPDQFHQYISKTSKENLLANIEVIQLLLEGNDKIVGLNENLDVVGIQKSGQPLSKLISTRIKEAKEALQKAKPPLSDTIASDKTDIENTYSAIRELLLLIKVDMANALAITITISDSDGD